MVIQYGVMIGDGGEIDHIWVQILYTLKKKNNPVYMLKPRTFSDGGISAYKRGCPAPRPQGVLGPLAKRHKQLATTP